ncbi:MAG: phage baseplate assembly protein V [Lachnospiraceae bacterium]|nr:phage baseplate assembly protein V [Lachnospiraceae bacterium]
MVSDYMGHHEERKNYGADGFRPTYDLWGTVLAPSEGTKKGSVRVKIKTMKDGMDTFENVPVLTGYGGGDHGVYCLPEEGDTVRLTFFGGDFRHPLVTGCRFPEDGAFSGELSEKGSLTKAWKMKNGSGITFTGEKGKDKVEISGSEKMAWTLDEEAGQIAFGGREHKNQVSVGEKDGKIQISAQSSICLTCGGSSLELKKDGSIMLICDRVTVKAKDIKIAGSAGVQMEGQELSLSGTTGLTVSGKGQVKVVSKGQIKLSGAMIQLN